MAELPPPQVPDGPKLRATFAPHDRSAPIKPVDVTADRTSAEVEIMAHLLQWEAERGPVDVTIRRDLSGGVVWVGPYCADQGWLITLEAAGAA